MDMLVGCTNKKFYLLHDVQAFYCNGTLRVVGITGLRFKSPFLQVSSPHYSAFFPPEHIMAPREQGSGEDYKNKEKGNMHLDQLIQMGRQNAAANSAEPIQSVIACPLFLSQHLLSNTQADRGFSLAVLARTVRRAAKTTFPLAFSDMANTQQKSIDVTACQQFLVRFEKVLRTAAQVPSVVFVRSIHPVPVQVNDRLRNITFWQLRLQESRFWKPTTEGEYEKRTAPMAYYNIAWGPTMSLYEIERQFRDENGP